MHGSTLTRHRPPDSGDDRFNYVSAAPSHPTTSDAEAVASRGHFAYRRNRSSPTNYKAHSKTWPAHDIGVDDQHLYRRRDGDGLQGQSRIEDWRRHSNGGSMAWPSEVDGRTTRVMSGETVRSFNGQTPLRQKLYTTLEGKGCCYGNRLGGKCFGCVGWGRDRRLDETFCIKLPHMSSCSTLVSQVVQRVRAVKHIADMFYNVFTFTPVELC